jgi:dTDP-4-dehydrorhamnose 3,5-epimerase
MHFVRTPLSDVLEVTGPVHVDARGSFRRIWSADSFFAAGITFAPMQSSLSTNPLRLTLRGMHWQDAPYDEQKLVRCVAGAVWDVALDLRPGSATYRKWHAVILSAETGNAFFLPRGIAHGFLSLTADAVVEYLIDTPYAPEHARGARWNDPAFAIDWPEAPAMIGDRDRIWPDFPRG